MKERESQGQAGPGRQMSASCHQCSDEGVTVLSRSSPPSWPCLLPLYPSHSLAHTFPSWLPVSSPRSREWPFDGCTPAFLLSSTLHLFLQKQHIQVSPAPSSLLKDENKETGVGDGRSKNWQKTLKENEFDRFVQFWIPVFLFPTSVRKAKTLPPRWLKSLRPLSAKRRDTHCFSPNYQRKVRTGHTSLSPNYWWEINLMLGAFKWVG